MKWASLGCIWSHRDLKHYGGGVGREKLGIILALRKPRQEMLLQVQTQPGLQIKIQDSPGYRVRYCLKGNLHNNKHNNTAIQEQSKQTTATYSPCL